MVVRRCCRSSERDTLEVACSSLGTQAPSSYLLRMPSGQPVKVPGPDRTGRDDAECCLSGFEYSTVSINGPSNSSAHAPAIVAQLVA